jgi:predicted transcriptional regulator
MSFFHQRATELVVDLLYAADHINRMPRAELKALLKETAMILGEMSKRDTVKVTAHVVAAYIQNNPVPTAGLPQLIASVDEAIGKLYDAPKTPPAVNPNRSVFSDHIVCLEDGKEFASLTKHLSVSHGLTPDDYRLKWRLPSDYPMVSPDYAADRSDIAKALGLGDKGRAAQALAAQKATPEQAV